MTTAFEWQAQVRDYELDRQNIVNHATFVHYYEEARNEYVRAIGLDFSECVAAGFDFVIAGVEVKYRRPLMAQNKFYITVKIESYDEKRIHFAQEIYLQDGDQFISKATVRVACVDLKTKRACMPQMLQEILERVVG
jgi:acyl-CoA thioester hydrolase